ncbi:MAG: YncE family protein [Acidobacteriota bacterium]|nr:YncE family protein [Acidobacteriota bacterium]
MNNQFQSRCVRWAAAIFIFFLGATAAGIPSRAAAKPAQAAQAVNYHIIKRVTLGGAGFWDYMGFDNANRHLFVSHGTHVMVVDADTFKVVGDIPDTPGVHGIAVAPRLNRGFISDGGADQVTVFNLKTLKTVGVVKVTGHNPDCIVYDPASERVFTFNGRSDNSTAIDARTDKVVGTIDLGGRPEFAVADGRGMIYNNLEDKSTELAIDSRTLQIKDRWPMAPCEHPSGLAIDAEHRILFAGCHNQVMGIMNAATGKVVATPPIGRGVDANRFDPGSQLAFSSNGDGTLTVVKEESPTDFKVVQNVTTERGARTMEVDPKTHNVFLVTAQFGPPEPPRPGQRFHRPSIVPGSFTLIVLAP